MLKNELSEIRELSIDELQAKELDLQKFLFDLKMKQKTMQLNDLSQFKKTRHKITFIKMLITQKSLSEVEV
ncbi:MAG: 50S ribosomal protein L29 [Vampirovibrionales bacterium]|jgi:ribosomal protein L29|nr:50S ribosomal protein L29 [Vampirovibrionales bacterium]